MDVRRVARDRGGDVPHVPGDSQYVVGEGQEERNAEVVVVWTGKYLTFAARARHISLAQAGSSVSTTLAISLQAKKGQRTEDDARYRRPRVRDDEKGS